MRTHIRATILTGAVAFLPLFAVVFVTLKSVQAIRDVVGPIVSQLGLDTRFGAFLALVLSLLALLFFVYLLGLLARTGPIAQWLERIEGRLASKIPGYSLIKGIVTGAIDEVETSGTFDPVKLRTADGLRLGFIVDRPGPDMVTVFLPNTPNPQFGVTVIAAASECDPVDLPAHRVLEALSNFGRGMPPK